MDSIMKSAAPVLTSIAVNESDQTVIAQAEKEKRLRKSCADFEAVFTYYLFKSMRDTIPSSGLMDKFPGKDTYTMLMDQKIAEELSQRGNGLGLKEVLYRQLAGKLLKSYETVNTVTPEKAGANISVSKD